jgi:hypothetical protein
MTARPSVIDRGFLPFIGLAILGAVVLGCSSDDDGAAPSPTATVAPDLRQDAPTIAQPSATSPPSPPTATSAPQPTDTPVPPTSTQTPVPPTPTQTPVPPTSTPTPEPGTITLQVAPSPPGVVLAVTVNQSTGCVPASFQVAAGSASTMTCGNGGVIFTIRLPQTPGLQSDRTTVTCTVEDEGAAPGAASSLDSFEFPDALRVVVYMSLQDSEDVRCVVTVQ